MAGLEEGNDICYESDIAFLTDLADLLGDIMVYCASEMVRFRYSDQRDSANHHGFQFLQAG